jgi:hypothetical protein
VQRKHGDVHPSKAAWKGSKRKGLAWTSQAVSSTSAEEMPPLGTSHVMQRTPRLSKPVAGKRSESGLDQSELGIGTRELQAEPGSLFCGMIGDGRLRAIRLPPPTGHSLRRGESILRLRAHRFLHGRLKRFSLNGKTKGAWCRWKSGPGGFPLLNKPCCIGYSLLRETFPRTTEVCPCWIALF